MHDIEAVFHLVAEMPLAGGGGPVTGSLERLRERHLRLGKRPVKLLGVRAVRVTAREQAGPAGAARTGRDERAVEAHPLAREPVEIRRADGLVPVSPAILPRHVIGDEEDEVRARGRGGDGDSQQAEEEGREWAHSRERGKSEGSVSNSRRVGLGFNPLVVLADEVHETLHGVGVLPLWNHERVFQTALTLVFDTSIREI